MNLMEKTLGISTGTAENGLLWVAPGVNNARLSVSSRQIGCQTSREKRAPSNNPYVISDAILRRKWQGSVRISKVRNSSTMRKEANPSTEPSYQHLNGTIDGVCKHSCHQSQISHRQGRTSSSSNKYHTSFRKCSTLIYTSTRRIVRQLTVRTETKLLLQTPSLPDATACSKSVHLVTSAKEGVQLHFTNAS